MNPHSSTPPKVLFCSYYSYVDHSSGAALATRDLLELLAQNGWMCHVLSGPLLDDRSRLLDALKKENVAFPVRQGNVPSASLYDTILNGVRFRGFVPATTPLTADPSKEDANAFLQLLDAALADIRPDLLLTYGGNPIIAAIIRRAKHAGVKTVFALRPQPPLPPLPTS